MPLANEQDRLNALYSYNVLETEPELVENLFSNHAHKNKEGTSGEKSTGLDLSIIKHFTDLHNGDIHVDSQPSEGTTFIISLPIDHKNPQHEVPLDMSE